MTELRLRLDRWAEAATRELTDRATNCCSFFGFTFIRDGADQVAVDVTVPAGQVADFAELTEDAMAVGAVPKARS